MEEPTRRVGTFTLGICLVFMGALFLVHLFLPALDYLVIFHLWPLIFILLGMEILISSLRSPQQKFQYDFAAIFIILLLICFAMGMAGLEWIFDHVPAGELDSWFCY